MGFTHAQSNGQHSHSGGNAPYWMGMNIADVLNTGDKNSLLTPATTITQDSNGYFNVSLEQAGAIDFTDPGDGAWAVFPAPTNFGNILKGGTLNESRVKMFENASNAFGASDDAWVVCGFCSETDLDSATVAAIFWGFKYTGGGDKLMRAGYISAGTDFVSDDAASSVACAGCLGDVINTGERFNRVNTFGLKADGTLSHGDFATTLGGTLAFQSSFDIYTFIAFGRTASTASVVTGGARPRYYLSDNFLGGTDNA